MSSVVGLLEERELAARQRAEELREEADRVLAELAEAERRWERFVIARQAVAEVLTEVPTPASDEAVGESVAVAPPSAGVSAAPSAAVLPGSVVPVWREGIEVGVLSEDYRRIVRLLADRARAGGKAMTCQEITAGLGLAVVPAKVEGVRPKVQRLVNRGWLAKEGRGRFRSPGGRAAGS